MSRRAIMVRVSGGGGALTSPATITIDAAQCGTADTTDFPLRINITNSAFRSVANGGLVTDANGHDIRFTSDSAGTTNLKWDPLIKYDAVTGQVVTNVKIPTLSHTTNTVIYCQIGDAGITTFQGGSVGDVWDANFKAVYSLGDGSTFNLNDLTANGDNLTNNHASGGTVASPIAGPNCGAADFRGNTSSSVAQQYMRNTNTLNIAHCTMEAWWNPKAGSLGNPCSLITLQDGVNSSTFDHIAFIKDGSNKTQGYLFDGASEILVASAGLSPMGDAWHYIALTNDGSTMSVYQDGASAATPISCGNGYIGYSSNNLFISGASPMAFSYPCLIAEPRVSNVARSSSYITATYNNLKPSSTFYTVT